MFLLINDELFGETGANPVRARRRKVHEYIADLTESHISGQAIGEYLRRPVSIVPSRNIRTRRFPFELSVVRRTWKQGYLLAFQ